MAQCIVLSTSKMVSGHQCMSWTSFLTIFSFTPFYSGHRIRHRDGQTDRWHQCIMSCIIGAGHNGIHIRLHTKMVNSKQLMINFPHTGWGKCHVTSSENLDCGISLWSRRLQILTLIDYMHCMKCEDEKYRKGRYNKYRWIGEKSLPCRTPPTNSK